ncbi:hypothetical protein A0J61_01065 [Choanephora cucurbitarum]|uniref:Zn(2)-C6 fungal-type domain-containing protein n=1 Tax=Choanephora cucurbitarum TaxID=101091 RepID=A0A1C7NP31_9FUNG|nr:hypothetical protein A0J61_01065 [Choanephora cucurbitarum]
MNPTSKTVDGEKTRRKRLKVVSACGECRRKKTKCNGEKPCAGCLKAHVECKYVDATKTATISTAENDKFILQSTIYPQPQPPSSGHSTLSSIESIEERLGAIENILRTLLGSGKNKHLLQGLPHPIEASHSPLHSDTPVHVPHVQNRLIPREKRQRHEDNTMNEEAVVRNDFGHGCSLAPIKIINHTPNIRNLLNNEEDTNKKPRWYPQKSDDSYVNSPSSAFFRVSSTRLTHDMINSNSASTAAGTS